MTTRSSIEALHAGAVVRRDQVRRGGAHDHRRGDHRSRGLPINALVEIAITARDRASSRSARATVAGVVRKPKLCEPGQLTRAPAQFDRYDAELIARLK